LRKLVDFFLKKIKKKATKMNFFPCIIQSYVVYLQSALKKKWKIVQKELF